LNLKTSLLSPYCIAAISPTMLPKLLRRLHKLFLEHADKTGAVGITTHKRNFAHSTLALQQRLCSLIKANGSHKFMYRLIGKPGPNIRLNDPISAHWQAGLFCCGISVPGFRFEAAETVRCLSPSF
jgi:hypothetical protein